MLLLAYLNLIILDILCSHCNHLGLDFQLCYLLRPAPKQFLRASHKANAHHCPSTYWLHSVFRMSRPYNAKLIKKGTKSYATRKRIAARTACAKDVPSSAYTPAIEASCTPRPPGTMDRLPAEIPMPKPDNNTPKLGA